MPAPPVDRTIVTSSAAPAALGPYSQAVLHGATLYCSGTIAFDADLGAVIGGGPAREATRCLENLAAVCAAAGTSLSAALRLTVYTTRLDAFADVNAAYAAFFPSAPPARVTIGVADLPFGATVEIDAIVACG